MTRFCLAFQEPVLSQQAEKNDRREAEPFFFCWKFLKMTSNVRGKKSERVEDMQTKWQLFTIQAEVRLDNSAHAQMISSD